MTSKTAGLALVTMAGAMLLSGCGSAARGPGLSSSTLTTRVTTDRNAALPFESTFLNRWNSRNDGSDYEPCVEVDSSLLLRLGVDPDSVRDAAGTDGQTLRGCRWGYRTDDGRVRWAVIQTVADSSSLEDYKSRYKSESWLDDLWIDGRVVGVGASRTLGECMTYVQSGEAAIGTLVLNHESPHAPIEEVCDRAIEFTKATIDKMPR